MAMETTYRTKHKRGHLNLRRILLLLFLAELTFLPANAEDSGPDNPDDGLELKIVGLDYVTVGVPTSFECQANCQECTYSMSLDQQTSQGHGNTLAFTVERWVDSLTVTCTVMDDEGEQIDTANKRLQVLAGPANLSITGPDMLNPTKSHTFSCYAYCRPSCTYAWMMDTGPWISGEGNVVSVTPQEMDSTKTLICKATNRVSGMFVSTVKKLTVTSGPTKIHIKGPDFIEVAETTKFECIAECTPSCHYVLSIGSQTVRGNTMEVTVDVHLKLVTIKCEVQNTVTKKRSTVFKTIKLKDLEHNVSIRPAETSAVIVWGFIILLTL